MGVNGGAGNAISLSEIQSYYGGSNPISVSEYNRGGSLVPATGTDTGTVSASLSGGNFGWRYGENTANGNLEEVTITIPANTVISTTQNWSWSITNSRYSYWANLTGNSADDGGYSSYNSFECDKSLTWFGNTVSETGSGMSFSSITANGLSKLCNFKDGWKLLWYVSAGSGVSVSNSGGTIYNYNYSSATRGNHFPTNIRGGANPTYQMEPTPAPTTYQGATVSVSDQSASGSITISGTSGSSGCTIKMVMVNPFNDPNYSAWMPALAAFTGTQSTTGNRNTNIPTAIGVGNSCNLNLFNAPGTPAP